MTMRKIILSIIALLVFSAVFAYPPSLVSDNPALIMMEKRQHVAIGMNLDLNLMQNFLRLDELQTLLFGEGTITLSKDRLQLFDYQYDGKKGLIFSFLFKNYLYGYLGFGRSKVGISWTLEGDPTITLPYDFMRIILKDVDYDENINEEFNLFNGGIYTKLGLFYGGNFGGNKNDLFLAAELGAFSPILWVDPNAKSLLYYHADPDEALLEAGISGKSVILTSIGDIKNPDFTNIMSSLGYYASVGFVWRYNPNPVWNVFAGLAINNLSLPAYIKYKTFGTLDFGFSLENLNPSMQEPSLDLGGLEELESASPVALPISYTIQTGFEFTFVESGLHAKFTPGTPLREMGLYASLFRLVWIDMTWMPYSFWRKSIGIDLDLRLLKLSVSAALIDRNLINFSPENALGFSAQASFSIGW